MAVELSVLPRSTDRVPEVVAVLARAFWRDPFFGWFSRDLLHEYRTQAGFQRSALVGPLAVGEVHVARDAGGAILGVAAWVPPDPPGSARLRSLRELARLAPTLGRIRHRVAAWRILAECARRHPSGPHWYLAILGVDPSAQGRGVGAALLAPVLERADGAGLPVWLETQKAENLAWYARFGFVEVGAVRIGAAPPIWLLERAPR